MKEQPAILSIRKQQGDRYLLDLQRSDEPFRGPIMQAPLAVQMDPEVAATTRHMLEDAVEQANRGTSEAHATAQQRFVGGGRGLFNALLPANSPYSNDLRRTLTELQTPLLLQTEEPNVLWELLHDGQPDGFLGLKLDIGRRLVVHSVPGTAPPREGPRRCLLIADPNEGEREWALPQTAAEVDKLRRSLEGRSVNCEDFLQGRDATTAAVTEKLLLHQYDIIHYAGHVVRDGDEYALRLHGGRLLRASGLSSLIRGRPIAFLNACLSAQAAELDRSVDSVQSLTNAFLQAGAQVVVGSLFGVPDEGGRVFAETFYDRILSGSTLGEAMRKARLEVYGRPQYGAAWACFVMYGDPCLRIELDVDEIQPMLTGDDRTDQPLSRADFDRGALALLEQALTYGRRGGVVGTPHLFAAMVNVTSTGVRQWLERHNVPPERLHGQFQQAFQEVAEAVDARKPDDSRTAESRTPSTAQHPATATAATQKPATQKPATQKPATLTPNARAILLRAKELAAGRISEADVVRAFAHASGGRTGAILRAHGLDVRELDPTTTPLRPQPPQDPLTSAGSLNKDQCTEDAWAIVTAAARHPALRGMGIDSSTLLAGMDRNPKGALARALTRVARALGVPRIRIEQDDTSTLSGAEAARRSASVAISETVDTIFVRASGIAAAEGRSLVAEADLLRAFVETGGGSTRRLIEKRGLLLEALWTRLLRDDGQLDLACFDASGQAVLHETMTFAARRYHTLVGRRHLLYGLLQEADGVLPRKLREQGVEPERLADLHSARLPAASPVGHDGRVLSAGLLRVLCAAETNARTCKRELVDSADLLRAWLDGDGGDFLVQNGVRLNPLM